MADFSANRPLLPAIPSPSNAWDCAICADTYDSGIGQPYRTAGTDFVCGTCIRSIFTQALEQEYHWPARWGPAELDIADFKELFAGTDLVGRCEERAREVEDRRIATQRRLEAQGRNEEVKHLPEDWVRGQDFQMCPRCHLIISLWDGCNHLVCPCGCNYCYICGRKANAQSGHWFEGKCRRWGVSGPVLPEHYDHDNDGNEDEEDEDDDEDEDDYEDEDDEREFEERFFDRQSFEPWLWNLAVQRTARDGTLQSLGPFQAILREPESDKLEDRSGPSEWQQWHASDAMIEWDPLTGIGGVEWELIMEREDIRDGIDDFVRVGAVEEFEAWHNEQTSHIVSFGLLRRPVGGVFNMLDDMSRLQALRWIESRLDAARPDQQAAWTVPEDYAVFDTSPDISPFRRRYGNRVLRGLLEHGDRQTHGAIEFERMMGNAVLVNVTGITAHTERRNPLGVFEDWFVSIAAWDQAVDRLFEMDNEASEAEQRMAGPGFEETEDNSDADDDNDTVRDVSGSSGFRTPEPRLASQEPEGNDDDNPRIATDLFPDDTGLQEGHEHEPSLETRQHDGPRPEIGSAGRQPIGANDSVSSDHERSFDLYSSEEDEEGDTARNICETEATGEEVETEVPQEIVGDDASSDSDSSGHWADHQAEYMHAERVVRGASLAPEGDNGDVEMTDAEEESDEDETPAHQTP